MTCNDRWKISTSFQDREGLGERSALADALDPRGADDRHGQQRSQRRNIAADGWIRGRGLKLLVERHRRAWGYTQRVGSIYSKVQGGLAVLRSGARPRQAMGPDERPCGARNWCGRTFALTSLSAPACTSTVMTSVLPHLVAQCSGVLPSCRSGSGQGLGFGAPLQEGLGI